MAAKRKTGPRADRAPRVHLPTGSVTNHRERAAVEDVVQALSQALQVEDGFCRHVLSQAQDEVAEFFRAGYSGEMAIFQSCMVVAMLAHAAQIDMHQLARVVTQQLAVCYDATGRISDAAHESVALRKDRGGLVVPIHH